MKAAQYYVRSGVHMTNLDNALKRFLIRERFIDVTLACDGHKFRCHRLVLAASSPFFEDLLMEYTKDHPIVIIPLGIKWHILKSLIDFMYKGETCVSETELKSFVESAELLQITGLFDLQTQFQEYSVNEKIDQYHVEEDPKNVNRASEHEQEETKSEENQEETSENEQRNEPYPVVGVSEINVTENQMPNSKIVEVIEIDESNDGLSTIENKETNVTEEHSMDLSNGVNTTEAFEIEVSENTDRETFQSSNTYEIGRSKGYKLKSEAPKNLLNGETYSHSAANFATNIPSIRVKPTIKLINLFQLTGRPAVTGQKQANLVQKSKIPWTCIHIPAKGQISGAPIQSPYMQVPLMRTSPLPWQLSELPKNIPTVAQTILSNPSQAADSASAAVPSFLKFNSSSMAISIKNRDSSESQGHFVNSATEIGRNAQTHQCLEAVEPFVKKEPKAEIELGETLLSEADFPMFYAMLKKEQEEKAAKKIKQNGEAETEIETEAEAEDIICQPNVSYIYDVDEDGKAMDCDNEAGVCIDYDRLVAETYGNVEDDDLDPNEDTNKRQPKVKPVALTTSKSSNHLHSKLPEFSRHKAKDPPTLVPLSVMHAGQGLNFYPQKTEKDIKSTIPFNKRFSVFDPDTPQSPPLEGEHSQHSVILRNPRCNQPRHYSNASLYNALMAVKNGESIYRASRLYQVPRKTLRNWMKRWNIKSKYPMPKQLKDAAKKKKQSQDQTA